LFSKDCNTKSLYAFGVAAFYLAVKEKLLYENIKVA